ncbi:MAG: alanine racemase [Spirochaetales bacterium]|nr:alanine racemase [Spirochaetales bacterium]
MYDYSRSRRATRALIHLENLKHNLEQIREIVGPDREICLAVKADAYGHGAVGISMAALKYGVSRLAVSNLDEGKELRQAGITAPILLLSYPHEEEYEEIVENRLEPLVGDEEYLQRLNLIVRDKGAAPLGIHIKIDTGMGRIGCPPEDAPFLARLADTSEGLTIAGICTHFPVGDSMEEEDIEFTEQQTLTLSSIKKEILSMNIDPGLVHAANSGGILLHKNSHLDMVRLGISAYGYHPDSRMSRTEDLKPVMELKTAVSFIKTVHPGQTVSYGRTWQAEEQCRIASVPVGYADGYFRLLSGKSDFLINGKRYPIAGRVCMDQLMINLGQNRDIKIGDEVTVFGPDPEGPDAAELADLIGTIPYELTCALTKRVPRIYVS